MCEEKNKYQDQYQGAQVRRDVMGLTTAPQPPRLDLDDIFKAPGPEDLKSYQAIRSAAKHFAQVVLDNAPPCADQTGAIRKIREAVMTANAAVALRGTI